MKRITIGVIVIFLFLIGLFARAQECKVLLKEISVDYKGDCKKGLAHGHGEAKGQNFSYTGDFKKGFPDGTGTLSMVDGNVFTGDWRRGEVFGEGELKGKDGKVTTGYFKGTIDGFMFMGKEKADLLGYKIIEKVRMENATTDFVRSEELDNVVFIKINENVIRQINNFEIVSMTSGTQDRFSNSGGRLQSEIVNVDYPVTFRIQYVLPYGGAENQMAPVLFRFTISQPGYWTVNITHR